MLKCERPITIPRASNSYQGVGGKQSIKDSLGSNKCPMTLSFEPPQKLGNIVKNLTKKFLKNFKKRLDFLSILCYNKSVKRNRKEFGSLHLTKVQGQGKDVHYDDY